MKKLLKVKIKREVSSGKTSYTYPKEYDPQKFDVIAYETSLSGKYNEVVKRGNDHEYVIGLVDENDIKGFLKCPDIVEINRQQAQQFFGSDFDKSEPIITDMPKVLLTVAKSVRGESLAQEEKDLLDPNHPSRGINKTKTYKNVLDENGI